MATRQPNITDLAPVSDGLTAYDKDHFATYLRLLDAEADGADWREVVSVVLGINPEREPARAKGAWESHLARAKWIAASGHRDLLDARA